MSESTSGRASASELAVRQKKFHKILAPTIIAVTNERVIVISRKLLPSKVDVDCIPFKDIMAVRFEAGTFFSSVFLRLTGSMPEDGLFGKEGENAGEFAGLDREDARKVAEYIEKAITECAKTAEPKTVYDSKYVYCVKCGTKNEANEAYCKTCGAALVK